MEKFWLFGLGCLLMGSCSSGFDAGEHYDAGLPFHLIDQQHPSGEHYEADFLPGDSLHGRLMTWLDEHKDGWAKAPHNTHAGLLILSQDDFRLLYYRDDDKVVLAHDDAEGEMVQYIQEVDANGLLFLVEE